MVNFFVRFLIADGRVKGGFIWNRLVYTIARLAMPAYYLFPPRSSRKYERAHEFVVVSLTSYPARINTVHQCIESLLRQTVAPTKIVLWLAPSQIDPDNLPEKLVKLESRGLEIRFCKDMKSHKKYLNTIRKWPDAILITVDDDVYYPDNTVEKLLACHKEFPKSVCCFRAHKILVKDGAVQPYKTWHFASPGFRGPSTLLSQVGVGGVLYPPGCLHKLALNEEYINKFCPAADDIWLKFMSLIVGVEVVKVSPYSKTLITVAGSQKSALADENVLNGKNDEQIVNVMKLLGVNSIESAANLRIDLTQK